VSERRNEMPSNETMQSDATSADATRPDALPDMTDYRVRFEKIQSEFIEEPKAAVEKAERLVEEAIERMTKSMHEQMQELHQHADRSSDTEQLRVTMRRYRDLIESLGGQRAA
jgi:hypothetical protein